MAHESTTLGRVVMTGNPYPDGTTSPCSGPQRAAAARCAQAERLAEAAGAAVEEVRRARRRRAEIAASFDDLRLGDRRALKDAKADALRYYREQFDHAEDGRGVAVAAATWLGELSRLNVASRRAVRALAELTGKQHEIDALVERLQLAADAARISAAAARQACLDARRALAACEEAHDARLRPSGAGLRRSEMPTARPAGPAAAVAPAHPDDTGSLGHAPGVVAVPAALAGEPAVVALLRGDRRMLQAVVSRLAEEIGQDAGRLQLLMLDLRHHIIASGQRACVYDFPPRHPFWGQFSVPEARQIAAALATLGRRFDGLDGWAGGICATAREMAMAISIAGRDPRSIRRHPTPAELETLWQGTTVAAAEFLFDNAPDLRLESLTALLGARADALSELWDNWGRLRPLLLGPKES